MGNSKYLVLPPFYHRDCVFLGLANTAGGLGFLGSEAKLTGKSTVLEYFSNDNSVKKRH